MTEEVGPMRRRRRKHSAEFKAQVAAACMQPGVSIAAVAMANGVNANLARRWVLDVERGAGRQVTTSVAALTTFVPVQMPAPAETTSAEIRIEVRRGPLTIGVSWPASAAAECATWMRELLR